MRYIVDKLSSVISFNPSSPITDNHAISENYLSDLCGYFADAASYEAALAAENTLLYQVQSLEWASGSADLICGFGILMPGKIGDEYYFTKGHYHERREAAEIYQGLHGEGYMLLEDEQTGESQLVPLMPNSIVYVPGYTAHRTINTGSAPLTYIGINVADAGHDYGNLKKCNFLKVVIEENGKPVMIDRTTYLNRLKG